MYKVNFVGGRRDKQSYESSKKIGGYVRLSYDDGVVEEYYRVEDSDEHGVYTLDN